MQVNPEALSVADRYDAAKRSEIMAAVRSKNTKPEILVRKLVYGMGYRYRLHSARLPGKPDLVFIGRRKVIFVHGCFWHRHKGCSKAGLPKTHADFWEAKLDANAARDLRSQRTLKKEGWRTLVVWQCQLGNVVQLTHRLKSFLED